MRRRRMPQQEASGYAAVVVGMQLSLQIQASLFNEALCFKILY